MLPLPLHVQGTVPGHPHSYSLDSSHALATGKWTAVDGNRGEHGAMRAAPRAACPCWPSRRMALFSYHAPPLPAAAILQHSWLSKHFQVAGDHSRHFGAFRAAAAAAKASCCG